ncbi:MAG: hypothetical protein RL398_105 [Planctomycetota bacterium]|jgi:hypothetical protein
MSRQEGTSPELAVSQLAERLHANARFEVEARRARREFFGMTAGDRPQPAAAEFRFAEWLVLERESDTLGAAPATVPEYGLETVLRESMAGVFLVRSAHGSEVDAEDLQDGESVELVVPAGSLLAGDLLVGRLYGTPDGYRPSSAAAVFRPGAGLAAAFRRDLERLAPERRLQQAELEHLLLRRKEQSPSPTAEPSLDVPLERLEAELEQLLNAGGADLSATELSQQLRDSDRPGRVIGPTMERLAFDTKVDLDRARRLLLEIWNAWLLRREPRDATPGQAPGASLGERLVQKLDDGLAKHQDVEELFAQLESMAGLEPGASDDDENPFDREDGDEQEAGFGDLEALVAEYLWETGREQEPAAAALRTWPSLQANAALPHVDVEDVTALDVQRLLLHVYIGTPGRARAAAVQTTFAELQRFYGWLEETQELQLATVLEGAKGGLLEQVDRLVAAGEALAGPDLGGRPTLLRLEDLAADGFGCVDDDGEHRWFAADKAALGNLRVGDLLLGAVTGEPTKAVFVGPVVALPADARSLIE